MAASRRTLRRALRILAWAALCVCLLAVAGAGAGVFAALPSEGHTAHGVFVGHRVPPPDESLGAWLETRRRDRVNARVRLLDGFDVYETTLGELGVEIDVAATMEAALRPGREGTLRERARVLWRARQGYLDVPLVYSLDERRAEVGLRPVVQRVRREPVDAHLNLTAHQRVADVPGVKLDVEATMRSVMRGVVAGHDTFTIQTRDVPAEVTLADLSAVDVTKVAASFETRFSRRGVGARRTHNIELAAKAIDGMVLKPGQSFSFNTVVGKRTLERGYT